MQVKTEGLIIREQTVGEGDRLVTLLTKDEGLIRAFAKRAKSLTDSKNSATGLLCYSRLSIFKGRETYIIDNASPIEVFFGLRSDISRLSLAQYFCELGAHFVPTGVEAGEYLRLILNSLSLLAKSKKPLPLLKAATELRMLSMAGYMPNLVACKECACYESPNWAFLIRSGEICCSDCLKGGGEPFVAIGQGSLSAMRHIIYSEFEKIYSFSLPDKGFAELERAAEEYTVNIMGKRPMTLDFYKSMLQ